MFSRNLKFKFEIPLVESFSSIKGKRMKKKGFWHKGKRFVPYTSLLYEESAIYQIDKRQATGLLLGLLMLGAGWAVDWKWSLTVLAAMVSFYYFADLLFNCFS